MVVVAELFDRILMTYIYTDVLPRQVRPCHYERGSEAMILRTLTNPHCVQVEKLQTEEWTVSALVACATCSPEYSCLIDAGALITGMSNEQVARALLSSASRKYSGCVFLDTDDRKMIVDRSEGAALPLARSGIPVERRYTFFDQVGKMSSHFHPHQH